MKVTIQKSTAKGKVAAPPSKSMAHRLLIASALAEGTSYIHGISHCADVLATVSCLTALGVKIEYSRDGDTVAVTGRSPRTLTSMDALYCRESGSTLRFLIPICLLSGCEVTLTGAPSLLSRPMGVYQNLAIEHGFLFHQDADGITVKGPLSAGEYFLPGNVSSQFITGLLFALPTLKGDSKIHITTPLESRSYILLTLRALSLFGVHAYFEDEDTLSIPGGQVYAAREVRVEGDYSGTAFLDALNHIGGEVEITGLDEESLQGDRIYRDYFSRLDAATPTLDITDCPDLAPILFALASAKKGARFIGTARLRIKESDRAQAMASELRRLGATVEVSENEVTVMAAPLHSPDGALRSYNDHRIVMSLAVLLTLVGGSIEGPEAVEKSFPDFFEKLAAIGIEVIHEI